MITFKTFGYPRCYNTFCILRTKTMKQLSLVALFFLGSFCCKKKNPSVEEYEPVQVSCILSTNIDSVKFYIQGTWQWIEEKRMDRTLQKFIYLTPQNQGYTRKLKLGNDTARFFKNNRPDSVYLYKVIKLTEITGTNFPEDEDPVLAFYRLADNARVSFVPLRICPTYLQLQYQYVRSIEGQQIWKKQ